MPGQLALAVKPQKRDLLPDEFGDESDDELVDERALVRACQSGDLAALERIYHEHQQTMLALAIRMLGRREDAEDAVQAAIVRLYRGIGRFRFDARLGTYVMRILINVCYDMLAARKQRQHLPLDPDVMQGAASTQPDTDLRLQLEQAILTLPERMRACFVLFAVEGYPQKEIAEMLEISVGTVKAQIFQAKDKLRALLNDPSEGTST